MANLALVFDILAKDKASKTFGDVGNAAEGVGGKISKLGPIAAAAGAAIGAGVAAAAAGIVKLGASFDDAFDSIRVGTGATGEALEGLEQSFKNVLKEVPTDFESASTAIADLSARTGMTGKSLETLAKQTLELSRLTKSDLSRTIAATTRLFGDWGVAAEDQANTLDKLFRASQSTGIGVDDLAEKAVQFGAPLRAMGFRLEETAGLLGKFEKEGVNAELVMGAMRKGLATFARAGEDAPKALARLTDEIKNAKTPTEGTAKALEVFGSKAGPDMAAAIREGRFDLGELMSTISDGKETISGAAADTEDFGEKWQKLKNRVFVALEPAATAAFDAIGTGLERLIVWMGENEAEIVQWGSDVGQVIVTFGEGFLQVTGGVLDGLGWMVDAFTEFGAFQYRWASKWVGVMDAAMGWVPGWGEKFDRAKAMLDAMAFVTDEKGSQIADGLHTAADGARVAADAVGGLRSELEGLKDKYVVDLEVYARARGIGPQGMAMLEGRHRGGPVTAGTPYIVGEREPELFVPDTSGRILNQRQMAGLGGVTIENLNVMSGPQEDAALSVPRSLRNLVYTLGV